METVERRGGWLRWTARGAGLLVVGCWLFIALMGALGGSEPWTWESGVLLGLALTAAVGVAVGWRREWAGGKVLLAVAIAQGAFAYLASGHNRGLAILVSGGPFLIVGLLFLISGWKRRKNG